MRFVWNRLPQRQAENVRSITPHPATGSGRTIRH
jgi:hypothetical protein